MGAIRSRSVKREGVELITNRDLVISAHALMGGIDLDAASSALANKYVEAEHYFKPSDDGLNAQDWYGSVYLFPPAGCYFWDKKTQRWKMTRSSAGTLISAQAIWYQKLYKSWLAGTIKQGVYFSNCTDMFRYEQSLFDFPVCILKTAPTLIRRVGDEIKPHKTSTSFVVYMPPVDAVGESVERFKDIYSEKGRIIC
jgi:hypothetical protein